MKKEKVKLEVTIQATKTIKITIPKDLAFNEKAIATIVKAKMLKTSDPISWKITDIWQESKEEVLQSITDYYKQYGQDV